MHPQTLGQVEYESKPMHCPQTHLTCPLVSQSWQSGGELSKCGECREGSWQGMMCSSTANRSGNLERLPRGADVLAEI